MDDPSCSLATCPNGVAQGNAVILSSLAVIECEPFNRI
jgi:hypothetical protein